MMVTHDLLEAAARGAVLLAVALVAVRLLRRAAPSLRALVLSLGLSGALVVPVVSALVPAWHVANVAALDGEGGATPPRAPRAEPVAEGAPGLATPNGATSDVARDPTRTTPSQPWGAAALGFVWAIGALLVCLRLCIALVRARRLVKAARPLSDPIVQGALSRAARTLGVRPIPVLVTTRIDTPAVTGVFAPVVLVPPDAVEWSAERWSLVLCHELAHVRRRDCLTQLVAELACALHWYDPLAWLAARRLRAERELAADDLVVATGVRPSRYAEHLVAIAARVQSERPAPAVAIAMSRRSQLVDRVGVLLADQARRAPSRAAVAAFAGASVAILLAVACASTKEESPRPTASTPSAERVEAAGATIDPRIQSIVDDEIDRLTAAWRATFSTVIVLDPKTGEILASATRSATPMLERALRPGSTAKAITLAAAIEEAGLGEHDRFFCEDGARSYGALVLHDAAPHGWLDTTEILAVSSNVGISKIADRLGADRLRAWLARFHVSDASLPRDGMGGAMAAIGEAFTAPPLQIAAAYAALANDGVYHAPTLARRGHDDGERLVKPSTARSLIAMLEAAVSSDGGTGNAARVAGVRVAGKTGTVDVGDVDGEGPTYASFVGVVPADSPRFVILVGAEVDGEHAWGGSVAAPAFARIAARALAK